MTLATDAPTRAQIEEAPAHHCDTLRRMPEHWVDKRAALHDKINQLLDQRDVTP